MTPSPSRTRRCPSRRQRPLRALAVIALATSLVAASLAVISFAQDGSDEPPPGGSAATREAPERIPEDMECLDCHDQFQKQRVFHMAVRDACEACHEQEDEELHEFTEPVPREELCTQCHDIELTGRIHEPAGKADCLACHDPHASSQPKLMKASMAQVCGACHESVNAQRKAHVHGPFGGGLCQVCHKAHSSEQPALLRAPGSELCVRCHDHMAEEDAGTVNWHAPAKEDCGLCHSGHESEFPRMLKSEQRELCTECHKEIGARATSSKFPHKAINGESGCGGCHDPHRSSFSRLLKTDASQLCLSCHGQEYPQDGERPLENITALLESNPNHHGPIRENNCPGCHEPHGGDHFRLLIKAYPERFYAKFREQDYDLCFSCHSKELVREERSRTTNFRDGDRNLHFLHVNRKKGRTCRACHETHASSISHHIRETTPFGEWELPVGFEKTETGGTCATGCHVPQTYVRGDE